jgi:hypothetical protein
MPAEESTDGEIAAVVQSGKLSEKDLDLAVTNILKLVDKFS